MKGTLPTQDSYRDTLKRVIANFHDAAPANLDAMPSVVELAAASLADTNAQ